MSSRKEASDNSGALPSERWHRSCGPVTDSQCGFKLFHSEVAKDLFASTTLTGFAFDVEVVAQARRRNHQMIELPIRWSDSQDSSFRPVVDGLKSFRDCGRSEGPSPTLALETV